jgi:hypothetical protein
MGLISDAPAASGWTRWQQGAAFGYGMNRHPRAVGACGKPMQQIFKLGALKSNHLPVGG